MRIAIGVALVVGLGLGACAGDEVDPGNGPVCTMALYDVCNEEHDCMSNMCHNFMGDGFQVCTQACAAGTPCPDQDGQPVTCNSNGICKPPAATDCRVLP